MMKRLSTNQILQVLLIVALVVNAVIHFTSPSYRFYKENFETVKKGVVDFENKVKLDFVPAILSIASNRVFVVSSNGLDNVSSSVSLSSSAPLLCCDSNNNSRLMSLDFRWYKTPSGYGFELDGGYYSAGDLLFGSVIRSVTPTMVVTDDYQFIKPLIGKFSLDSSVTVSPRPVSSPVSSNSNSSVYVPMSPDPYFPQKEIRKGLNMEY